VSRRRSERVTIDRQEPPPGIFLARPEPLPEEGISLAIKDLFDTAGLTTTYGSAIFADHVPEQTAEAVRRLEAAGYANVGKTNLHEFAYGTTSANPHFGAVPNPVAPGRVAGGSSGGNAAGLALGLADAALGSDSGGSVRIPAACCGIVGFKPTYGLVPLEGCFPLAPSFDHAGPMARDVGTCVAIVETLAPGFTPSALESLEELTVGVAWLDDADPLVRARVEEVAARFPRRRRLDVPFPEAIGAVFMREVADIHRELYAEQAELYGENVATKIERCLAVTDEEYRQALAARESYRERLLELLDSIDLAGASGQHRSAPHAHTPLCGPSGCTGRADDPRDPDPLHLPLQRDRSTSACASVRPGGGGAPRLGSARGQAGRRRARARRRSLDHERWTPIVIVPT
jgi:Asp-tRNA(Asn)/Glu-tRNA(Gln) amidotransferase A subunit family amidase